MKRDTVRSLEAADRRRKDLAAIHVMASKQLRLDEDTYRALLERLAGKRSAADLNTRERMAVLDELRRLVGGGVQRMRNAVPPVDEPTNVRAELRAMVSKVGAILEEAGRSWAYAHGLANRMFRVQRVEWLTASQLHRLVAALSIDQKRRRVRRVEGVSNDQQAQRPPASTP